MTDPRSDIQIQLSAPIADRICPSIDNIRALEIQSALNLSASAAWVLVQMEANRSGVDADKIHYESPTERHPFFRKADLMERLISQIHNCLGKDATLTEHRTIKLTPMGRLRIKKALGEVVW